MNSPTPFSKDRPLRLSSEPSRSIRPVIHLLPAITTRPGRARWRPISLRPSHTFHRHRHLLHAPVICPRLHLVSHSQSTPPSSLRDPLSSSSGRRTFAYHYMYHHTYSFLFSVVPSFHPPSSFMELLAAPFPFRHSVYLYRFDMYLFDMYPSQTSTVPVTKCQCRIFAHPSIKYEFFR